jgi:hypothetical protein
MIEELSLDALFHWILESDDVEEIHELVKDYMDGGIPVFD